MEEAWRAGVLSLSSLVSLPLVSRLSSLYLSSLYFSSDRYKHDADDKAGSMKRMTRLPTCGPTTQDTAPTTHKDQETLHAAACSLLAARQHMRHGTLGARCESTHAPDIYPTSHSLFRDTVSCD